MTFHTQRLQFVFLAALTSLGSLLGITGCTTTGNPPAANPDTPPPLARLSRRDSATADALAHFSEGVMAEYSRNYPAALSNYMDAVRYDPENEDLNLRIVIGLLQQKREAEALKTAEAYSRRHPKSEKSLVCLALIYRAANRLNDVEATYRRLIQVAPQRPEYHIELAAIYLASGKDQAAIKLLRRAIDQVDDSTELLRVLAGIYAQRAGNENLKQGRKKDFDAAISALQQASARNTNDTSLLFQIGDLYINSGDIGKAVESFGKIEDLSPDNLQVKEKAALSFLTTSNGIPTLEQYAAQHPGDGRIYYYIGELYCQTGNVEKAIQYFEQATEHSPTNSSPYMKLAALQLASNAPAALKVLDEGLQKMPGNPYLLEMTAYVQFGQKDYAKAAGYFAMVEKAIANEDPDRINPAFYFNYAIAAQMSGDMDRAAVLLNTAYEKNPVYLDAFLQYAFKQKNDAVRQSAIKIIETFGQSQPDEPNVYVYLGFLNSYLKSNTAAIADFEKAEAFLQDSPQKNEALDATYYFWYAAACERDGQFERAEKLFATCLELDPKNPEAYNYLAYMWAEKGIKLDMALDYAQKALKLNPKSGAFVDTLGWVYYMQGKYKEAFTEIEKATKLMPDDPTITDHDGDVLFKLGDEKQALPQWQRSFVLDPENAKVAEKLKARSIDLEPLRKEAAEYKKKHDEEEAKKADAESSDLDQDVSSSPEDLMAPPSDDTNEPPSDLDEDPESAPED